MESTFRVDVGARVEHYTIVELPGERFRQASKILALVILHSGANNANDANGVPLIESRGKLAAC